MIDEAMPQIAEQINKFMPKIIELGGKLLKALGDGLVENLPMLMSTAGNVIGQLANALIDNLPQILEVGIDVILELIDGLTEAMPELVPKMVEIINKMIEVLIDHAPELTEAGFKLLLALAEGIIKSIPNQIEGIWHILTAIDSQIKGFFENMKQNGYEMLKRFCQGLGINLDLVRQRIDAIKNIIKIGIMYLKNSASNWGSDFVQGFADGIMNRLYHLGEVVNRMANSIRSRLHFSRPDEGPLRDYETWMPDMLEGMSKSLEKAMPSFMSKVHALSDEMAMSLSPSINGGAYSYSPSMSVVVNNNIESDPLGQMVNQVKTFSNGAKNDYNYGYGG